VLWVFSKLNNTYSLEISAKSGYLSDPEYVKSVTKKHGLFIEDTYGCSAEAGIPKPLKKSKHNVLSSDFPIGWESL